MPVRIISISGQIYLTVPRIGWVREHLYSLVFEIREDDEGEFYHLVTLWKSTREEEELYAEST